MALYILTTFSLCLLFSAVLSKPLTTDTQSLEPSNNMGESKKLLLEIVLRNDFNSASDVKLVQSLEDVLRHAALAPSSTDSEKPLRRGKRQVIRGHRRCPNGMLRYLKRCMTFEEYERLVKQIDEE